MPAFVSASDYWTAKAPMPYATGESPGSAAVLLSGKIYVVGLSGSNPNPLEVYDPALNSWTEKAPLPHYSGSDAIAVCQNKIYDIIANQSYDPTTNTWSDIAPSPSGNSFFQPVVVDGKIFEIGGGYGLMGISSANWVYDPVNNSWSQMAPIPTQVETYASVVLDDKIYILGGYYFAGGSNYLPTNLIQIFDPATNQWSQGTPMPYNMSDAAASLITDSTGQQNIFLVGGAAWNGKGTVTVNWTQIYDLKTNSWSTGAALPTPREGLSLVNVNGDLYALGGVDVLEYTPEPNGVSASPSLLSTSSPTEQPTTTQSSPNPSPSVPELSYFTAGILVVFVTISIFVIKKQS